MTKYMCMFCFKDFEARSNKKQRPNDHNRKPNQNDLLMCPSCEVDQIIREFENSFIDHCLNCGFRYNVPGTCACLSFNTSPYGIRIPVIILKNGHDMLYCHYEKFALPVDVGNMPAGSEMIKFKFSSSVSNGSVVNFKRDGDVLKKIVELIKQIPSGKRSYDPSTYIWTMPFVNSQIISLVLNTQLGGNNSCLIEHPDLDQFLNPLIQSTKQKNSWKFKNVKVENPEDFFYKPPSTMPVADLQTKLLEIFKMAVPTLTIPDWFNVIKESPQHKEFMLRGYKISARKLHPDLGGDPVKMSELNELWAQYKELVQ